MAVPKTTMSLQNNESLGDLAPIEISKTTEKRKNSQKVEEEQEMKKKEAIMGIKKLLATSQKYSEFCDKKLNDSLHKTEEGRLKAMMDNNSNKSSTKKSILSKLNLFHGTLRDYQIEGVAWLKTLFEHGVNGILADEMGLGKTIQVIAFLCHLMEREIKGPFLIVVPLSTLPNWTSEFKRFAPTVPCVIFHGDKHSRHELAYDIFKIHDVDGKKIRPVVITTLQMISKEHALFKKIVWKYLIVDEAHSLKNYKTNCSAEMRELDCLNKVLLTGTPLQNNLEELWSLLNFIMPRIFKDIDTFSSLLLLEDFKDDDKIVQDEMSNNIISSIHKVLATFMLRRLKSEVLGDIVPKKEVLVYCPLSKLQRDLYKYVLEKNISALRGEEQPPELEELIDTPRKRRKCTEGVHYKNWKVSDYIATEQKMIKEEIRRENETPVLDPHLFKFIDQKTNQAFIAKLSSMAHPLMLFKKIVNHPYLVHIPVTPDGKDVIIDESIISESGKMLVMDAMLKKLKKEKHKVLIFSTLVMMLDLIEEYLIMKNYTYCRLDGNTSLEERGQVIDQFNTNPDIFLFIISTRAGGLGLNLTGADTVILFDRDWNPQVDLQAQDRCHRIGQTKPVMVFSLITKNTIDEAIVDRASAKRRLEKVVIKNGKFKTTGNQNIDLMELREMLKTEEADTISSSGRIYSDKEINQLLDRSELYKQMETIEDNKENTKRKMNEK